MTKQDWDQFTVSPFGEDTPTTRETYDNFLEFRRVVDQLPKPELRKRGWLDDQNEYSSLLPIFNEIHGAGARLFRRRDDASDALCIAWTAFVRAQAKQVALAIEVPKFRGIDAVFLEEIAKLSPNEGAIKRLPEILAEQGIILIYERALPSMKMDGVVFKLKTGQPVIGHSFRFPRLDNFWFTLMHELAHVVLHSDTLDQPIYEDLEGDRNDQKELEADRLAKKSFVKRSLWRNCEPRYKRGHEAVERFAHKVGIHPAIIAGLLSKEENNYQAYSGIVNKVDVRKLAFEND
ncbi:MAG: ImmA/IrrE family metallo-endopeptidase [Candidatus Reddybacter sp.]